MNASLLSNLQNKIKDNAANEINTHSRNINVLSPQLAAEKFPLGNMGDQFASYMLVWSLEQWRLFHQLTASNIWAQRKIVLDSVRARLTAQFNLPHDLPDYALDEIEKITSENAPCSDCDGSVCRKSHNKHCIDTFELQRNDDWYDVFHQFYRCQQRLSFLKRRERDIAIQRNSDLSGVPKRYSTALFNDFISTRHNAHARRSAHLIINSFADKGLFISGPPGVGKTLLLSIIANELLRNAHQVIFYTVPVLLRSIKATFEPNSDVSTDQICRSVSEAPVLFLDDFGSERMSEWVAEQLFNIVNFRYEAMLPTFFSSNFDLQELKSKMSIDPKTGRPSDSLTRNAARLVSRIQSMCQICSIIDDDWRAQI